VRGQRDARRGRRRRLPVTYWTFLIGCLSIAGVFPLAGFWSKDAILAALADKAGHGGEGGIYGLLLLSTFLGVVLIDFYMFRPLFLVFHGPERLPPEADRHAHESPGTMTAPLVVLAFGAAVVGAYFEWTHGLVNFLAATPSLACLTRGPIEAGGHVASAPEHWGIAVISSAITILGIAAAAVVYLGNGKKAARLAAMMNIFGLYSLSYGKFFFDPLYSILIVQPLLGVARLAAWFDRNVIDALVDFVGQLPSAFAAALRPVQGGVLQFYALAMALGLLALLGVLLM
jgi:NADH-quinone oxidoreductase subunit L